MTDIGHAPLSTLVSANLFSVDKNSQQILPLLSVNLGGAGVFAFFCGCGGVAIEKKESEQTRYPIKQTSHMWQLTHTVRRSPSRTVLQQAWDDCSWRRQWAVGWQSDGTPPDYPHCNSRKLACKMGWGELRSRGFSHVAAVGRTTCVENPWSPLLTAICVEKEWAYSTKLIYWRLLESLLQAESYNWFIWKQKN